MSAQDSTSSHRFSTGCFLSAAAFVAIAVGGGIAFVRYADGVDTIAALDCGQNREILITADRAWEVSQPVYYLIRVDGDVAVPPTYFANIHPPYVPRFVHTAANDGDLVGVSYADEPSDYLFLHDFSTGETYDPGDRPDLQALLDATQPATSAGR